ncbi:MAG TPA: biosynthetic arginine decarboxylase [Thermoanaerobaculia bacterium]|jgi:arginine decarboxylase|nr:biosynthetic arginine decarboxylase [Thermoanaerobaculia bacterium]
MTIIAPDRAAAPSATGEAEEWTLESARLLYRIDDWGKGYFGVNERGHVTVRPRQDESTQVDLLELVHGLHARGLTTPLLLRFPDLLEHRLEEIYQAFQDAIVENGYRGRYHAVFPIKVNQQRHVVDEVIRYGARFGFGLEVGSKPELLAALAVSRSEGERPIICNGFKDDEYIESAVLARKLGRNIIPVVESFPELLLIAKHSERYGVEPRFGVRVKLAASGAGRWSESAGYRSKFGLTIPEVIDAMKYLEERGMTRGLELLHCHMGSQIHDIKNIKDGINELAHVYVELTRMGAGLRYLDVGGGLGVDYDGSQSNFESSMNYTLREYAGDVIYRVMNVCDNAHVPHPTIITECGRAMVAFHSLLVFDVLGSSSMEQRFAVPENLEEQLDEEVPQPLFDLLDAFRSVSEKALVPSYHDAVHARDEAMHLFSLGYLSLPLRALAERLFWATCGKIRALAARLEEMPEELEELEQDTRDTYFCNFSLFQSVPDSWALRQIFPVMPIHKLEQEPTRRGILADITCDSDGKLDIFQDPRVMKKTLELHPIKDGDEYFLAVFLVGAYQETLGDLHNLFGDTHVVHVKVDPGGGHWSIDEVVEGDTVREVLAYFQYNPEDLFDRMFQDCETAVREGRMTVNESRSLLSFYRNGLNGYTYLEAEEGT